MPGLIGAVAVGLGWNAYVFWCRRYRGIDKPTTSSAIRELRKNPLGDLTYRALDRHWSSR